jgi:hypothetical protein
VRLDLGGEADARLAGAGLVGSGPTGASPPLLRITRLKFDFDYDKCVIPGNVTYLGTSGIR